MKAPIRIVAYIAGALRADVPIPKDILIAAYITKAIKFAAFITKTTWTDVYIAKAIKIALFVIAKDILCVVFIIIIALSPALTTIRPLSSSPYSPRPPSRMRGLGRTRSRRTRRKTTLWPCHYLIFPLGLNDGPAPWNVAFPHHCAGTLCFPYHPVREPCAQ